MPFKIWVGGLLMAFALATILFLLFFSAAHFQEFTQYQQFVSQFEEQDRKRLTEEISAYTKLTQLRLGQVCEKIKNPEQKKLCDVLEIKIVPTNFLYGPNFAIVYHDIVPNRIFVETISAEYLNENEILAMLAHEVGHLLAPQKHNETQADFFAAKLLGKTNIAALLKQLSLIFNEINSPKKYEVGEIAESRIAALDFLN